MCLLFEVGLALGLLASCTVHGGSAMTQRPTTQAAIFSPSPNAAIVRYLIEDAERAVAFYSHLGFKRTQQAGPVTIISRGELHLLLSGAGSSGARPMPDGNRQQPGGWNRIVVYVENLDATIAALRTAGAHFRNEVEVGPGGRQILVDDPDGNPVELHEAPAKQHT
jgi:catechol 2,3-dioxygenase-like lactoylglutathione lyase family enzyme